MIKLFLPKPMKLAEKGNISVLLKATMHKNNEVKLESLRAVYYLLKNKKKILGVPANEKLSSSGAGEILLNQLNHDWPSIRQKTIQCLGLPGEKAMVTHLGKRISIDTDRLLSY